MMSENEANAQDTQTATEADDAAVDTTTENAANDSEERGFNKKALTGDVGKDKDDYDEALARAMTPMPEAVGDDEGDTVSDEDAEEPDDDDEAQDGDESEQDEADEDSEDNSHDTEDDDETGQADDDSLDEGSKPPQFRFRPDNELDLVAFNIKKSDPSLTLDQSLDMARIKLGIGPKTAKTQDSSQESTEEGVKARSSEEIEAEITEKMEQSIDAMSGEYDAEKWGELQREIIRLQKEQKETLKSEENARMAQSREQAEAQSKFQREFEKYDQEAIAQYDANGITNPNSKFHRRMQEIHQAWEMAGDDRVNSPKKTLEIARIVALEQGVKAGEKPRKAPTKAPSTKPPIARKTQAAPKTAGANARTQEPTNTSLEKTISSLNDPREYEDLMASLGA